MSRELLDDAAHRKGGRLSSLDYLDVEARTVMTPGVIAINEHSSLRQAYNALSRHRVHSLLVVDATGGRPLGWVTARGLLAHLDRDDTMICVREAITHPPACIEPSTSIRQALTALKQPGLSQLLVSRTPDAFPEGVIADLDIVALAAR